MAAARSALSASPEATKNVAAARAAVLAYLTALDGPAHALDGLTGPIWFDAGRIRHQTVRFGQFHGGSFESAPLQIVPVDHPDPGKLADGSIFETGGGHFGQLQRVVHTGVYINEIQRIDLAQSNFGADFYLWLRYAHGAGDVSADPTDLTFPNMVGGTFDRTRPVQQGLLKDGTEYRLWRVQGQFRNDFDLHEFPFDGQQLAVSFFNARAASDTIVYVLDRESTTETDEPSSTPETDGAMAAAAASKASATAAIASPYAFRSLTQWLPLAERERRDNLVTESALGDPRAIGVERHRELSGFLVTIDVQRRALATLVKNLLPLGLMTLLMFASLYFPVALVKEKVTVAITAALSGAVLLTAINNQLGGIGYTIAVEYAFYVFFALSLLCIVAVLSAERLRAADRKSAAMVVERWTRIAFMLAVAATLAGAAAMAQHSPRGLVPV
jgi:hypothetical protein